MFESGMIVTLRIQGIVYGFNESTKLRRKNEIKSMRVILGF